MGWWVADMMQWGGPAFVASWAVWVIGSIVLHELSHGWAAIRQGDDTPIETGHMTWNPLVHMGMYSLIVFAILGIAWGAMPVNPNRFRSRYGDSIVSFAGPAMNLLLAAIAIVGLSLWTVYGVRKEPVFENVQFFFFIGAALNIVLALFNLIPIPPLDGSRILEDFFPQTRRLYEGERGAVIGLLLFFAIFWFAGDVLFGTAFEVVRWCREQIVPLLPTPPTV